MSTHSATRQLVAGLVALAVVVGGGGWLALSYLGVISRDVRITADVVDLGDALAPGAKVRYDGMIVGRVQGIEFTEDGPRVSLLIDRDQAGAIAAGSTARVLPNTLFGSEYVELVAPAPQGTYRPLTAGAHLAADRSQETLQLMAALGQAQDLLAVVDAEALSQATGTLATALDGRGESFGFFIERADALVTTVNGDTDLIYGTLSDVAAVGDVLTTLLPSATAAAEHARTTAATLVGREADLDALISATEDLSGVADHLVTGHAATLVELLRVTGGPLEVAAAHPDELQAILTGVPGVLHNGATAIDESSIQMNGLIALDPLDPYTALDCPVYGPLRGGNCEGPLPPGATAAEPTDPAMVDEISRLLQALGGEPVTPAPPAGATDSAPPTAEAPVPAPESGVGSPLQQLFLTLLGSRS